ncbi:MAG TPA: hypothetical protein PKU97_07625 [Kofleriaceae bacterium]|nr:hypothetical protein [Kofleriaceae bacterium]
MSKIVACWLVALSWAACSYDSPSFDGVEFHCDARHGCPPGQKCSDGLCGSPDLGLVGVVCGETFCSAPSLCCDDFINPPRCVQPGISCAQLLECDGKEDCEGNETCCASGNDTECVATCSANRTVCSLAEGQCPSGEAPNCCRVTSSMFKECSASPCR